MLSRSITQAVKENKHMQYHTEILDRKTGELVSICNGDWITVTELGQAFDLGPRQVRQVLHRLGWVFPTAAGRGRFRLTPEAIKARLGRSICKSKSGRAFDVISPEGQLRFAKEAPSAVLAIVRRETEAVLKARSALEVFRGERKDAEKWTTAQQVSWLNTFWPQLSQDEVAAVLSISKQLVSYHVRRITHRNG